LRLPRLIFIPIQPQPCWLGLLRFGLPPGTSYPVASISGVSALAPVRPGVLTRDRPVAPKQSANPGTAGKLVTTGRMNAFAPPGASLEVFVPSAHVSRVALVSGAASLRTCPASAFQSPVRFFAFERDPCGAARMADVRGGSFDHDSSDRQDARPVVFDLSRGRDRKPIRALAAGPTISSATASIASSDRVMHHRVLSRDVPLRRSDFRGLAGRSKPPSFQRFSPGGTPGISGPSQVCSRERVARHFCRAGPTCRFRHASAPIDFRRGAGRQVERENQKGGRRRT